MPPSREDLQRIKVVHHAVACRVECREAASWCRQQVKAGKTLYGTAGDACEALDALCKALADRYLEGAAFANLSSEFHELELFARKCVDCAVRCEKVNDPRLDEAVKAFRAAARASRELSRMLWELHWG